MTPAAFLRQMQTICAQRDTIAVKREALSLVMKELGAGVPGYLPGLEHLLTRLGPSPFVTPKDFGPPREDSIGGIGGTDGGGASL